MKTVCIIFPHQLFFNITDFCDDETEIYLIEEYLYFNQYKFHKQKIAFHRATMKNYEAYLKEKGLKVNYIEAQNKKSDIRILINYLGTQNVDVIQYTDTVDYWLEDRIEKSALKNEITLKTQDSPNFINTKDEIRKYFDEKNKFLQANFYKSERKRLRILVLDNEEPVGDKWSFDDENRKKYPKDKQAPNVSFLDSNNFYKEAFDYVEKNYGSNPGEISGNYNYPIDRQSALNWLSNFHKTRFSEFGTYEDAIVSSENFLNHSILTPVLNVGLLSPKEVVKSTLDAATKYGIPLNSTEGFIRQIIGWREFIRGVYLSKGSFQRTKNFWGFKRKIPKSFYDGSTGIDPVDDTIKKVLRTGYCHHIERLMILGNFMLLCGFDPDEVYRWFMELFIDAYDWVMVPNVYGMSQFADGGTFATKPYISGSNYVIKMSDYKKGEWSKVWDALFWRFMDVNRGFFLKNHRLGMLVRTFDKMSTEKQEGYHSLATTFLEKIDNA